MSPQPNMAGGCKHAPKPCFAGTRNCRPTVVDDHWYTSRDGWALWAAHEDRVVATIGPDFYGTVYLETEIDPIAEWCGIPSMDQAKCHAMDYLRMHGYEFVTVPEEDP